MATSYCDNCGNTFHWNWEEAFDKFGFGDGDGQVETWQVHAALKRGGYEVEEYTWGIHNTIIISIKKEGIEQVPENTTVGYDDPRRYLPREIISLLDREFPTTNPIRKKGR